MFLAFQISDIITVPFGYLMGWLYNFTSNYGIALILFAVIVKLILFPVTAKSKKSTMKMSRMTPLMQEIQKKYPDDQQKQSQAMQELYKREGVSMTGGCLWGFVPLLILFPLYTVVRQPIVYILQESAANAEKIVEIVKTALPDLFTKNNYYDQMIAAKHIPAVKDAIQAAIENIRPATLEGMNFDFLHIDMGAIPQFNVFRWEAWDWAHIGAFLLPVLSAGSQILSSIIMQKMNNSLVTNEKGVQDEEIAKNSQTNQSMKMMMYAMPLVSLWFGFTVPAGLSLYWLVQGLVTTVMDVYLTQKYRKIYDAEDAERLKKALAEEAAEAEKERIRAERRAANPDGITSNTSKKKLQQQQARQEQEAKTIAAREYAAKKGVPEEESRDNTVASGIPSRPYCRGRAYDPNRYGSKTTED